MLDSANKQAKPAGPPKPRPADPVAPEVRTPERVSFQLFTRPPTRSRASMVVYLFILARNFSGAKSGE